MNFKLFLVVAIIATTVYASHEPSHMRKRRMQIEKEQGFHKINSLHTKQRANRRMQAAWRPLKIYFDTTSIYSDFNSQGAADRAKFYKVVFKATGKWWESFKVNDDRSKIAPMIKQYSSRYSRELGFNFEGGKKIEDYDLLIRVFLCPNNGSALAYAGPFLRHPDSQRPITGTVCI